MHRTIEIVISSEHRDQLVHDLERLDDVIGISVHERASRKPGGDVVIVQALNESADEVLRSVERMKRIAGSVFVVTAEAASFNHPEHQERIDRDTDEAIWEEMETSLRNRGQLTLNFVALMALGGAIAAAGLSADPTSQATAFVSASIIAPAFEPIAKFPLGVTIRNRRLLRDAISSFFAGYAALLCGAALTIALLGALGITGAEKLIGNPEVVRMMHPPFDSILTSACAALAGLLIETTYRESLLAGPVIGLILVPTASLAGAGVAILDIDVVFAGLKRFGIDLGFIIVFGVAVFMLKQAVLHRRRPVT